MDVMLSLARLIVGLVAGFFGLLKCCFGMLRNHSESHLHAEAMSTADGRQGFEFGPQDPGEVSRFLVTWDVDHEFIAAGAEGLCLGASDCLVKSRADCHPDTRSEEHTSELLSQFHLV